MVPEASLEKTDAGFVPKAEGWFVVNSKEARWFEHEKFGSGTIFEGEPAFPELGINIGVLEPGQPACLYHRENAQENFLVLWGECLLVVEGRSASCTRGISSTARPGPITSSSVRATGAARSSQSAREPVKTSSTRFRKWRPATVRVWKPRRRTPRRHTPRSAGPRRLPTAASSTPGVSRFSLEKRPCVQGLSMVGDRGFEPRTSALSERRSNQLS
jgi:hypothetical protein